ncbi:hypothetical protein ACH4F0_44795 [Streptomyces chartreusis]|uniref:hypothetical protein n=1 Tax=Streptomyces chartreusis TaxID=1969 RepID=UPI00379C2294
MTVSGRRSGRLSVAGLIAMRPGSRTRLCHRLRTHPGGKGKRRSMGERDVIALIDGVRRLVKAPIVLVWDRLNTHVSHAMADAYGLAGPERAVLVDAMLERQVSNARFWAEVQAGFMAVEATDQQISDRIAWSRREREHTAENRKVFEDALMAFSVSPGSGPLLAVAYAR